ncbi:hypothetical protein U9M48_039849 [Paspalum notatum var. saurae]|uniref:Uncharacterized protein n=1 Tax=Paspalum notatum var. saurae TaxID=547442 RepID=A0AAQ3XF00_PASNO
MSAVDYSMATSLPTNVHWWGLGGGALEYDRIPRPQRIGQGSSHGTSSRAQQETQEKTRRLEEETRRLREDNDYMKTYLVELSQRLGTNVPEFRPPQLFPQVPPNYFVSTPSSQGQPFGDAQGSQPPPNWIVPSGQASPIGDATQVNNSLYLSQYGI